MPSVLLFGATGQMGSHLVVALKKTHPNLPLTVYLRNTDVDEYMKSTVGVDRIVHGDFSEAEKISTLSKEHDIVINIGSSWFALLSEAIVAGLSQKTTGPKPILIHISGAGNFVDHGTTGEANPKAKVWNDDDEETMKELNPQMLNGGPDKVVLTAGKEGKIVTYIIFPSGAYGASIGPIKAPGVIQLLMYQKAKELEFMPYVGPGTSIFNTIHVEDIHPFILKVLDMAMTKEPEDSPFKRLYIIGSNNDNWKDISTEWAKAFYAQGVISSPEPKSIKLEDAGTGEIASLMGSNMTIKCDRAVRVGFKPTHPTLLEHISDALKFFDWEQFNVK